MKILFSLRKTLLSVLLFTSIAFSGQKYENLYEAAAHSDLDHKYKIAYVDLIAQLQDVFAEDYRLLDDLRDQSYMNSNPQKEKEIKNKRENLMILKRMSLLEKILSEVVINESDKTDEGFKIVYQRNPEKEAKMLKILASLPCIRFAAQHLNIFLDNPKALMEVMKKTSFDLEELQKILKYKTPEREDSSLNAFSDAMYGFQQVEDLRFYLTDIDVFSRKILIDAQSLKNILRGYDGYDGDAFLFIFIKEYFSLIEKNEKKRDRSFIDYFDTEKDFSRKEALLFPSSTKEVEAFVDQSLSEARSSVLKEYKHLFDKKNEEKYKQFMGRLKTDEDKGDQKQLEKIDALVDETAEDFKFFLKNELLDKTFKRK